MINPRGGEWSLVILWEYSLILVEQYGVITILELDRAQKSPLDAINMQDVVKDDLAVFFGWSFDPASDCSFTNDVVRGAAYDLLALEV